tara:strand:- start:10 stop:168 length:159 start_codon:yes stop_codon:yes gene_type:complete
VVEVVAVLELAQMLLEEPEVVVRQEVVLELQIQEVEEVAAGVVPEQKQAVQE